MSFIPVLLKYFGGFSLIAVALFILGKIIVSYFMKRELQQHKSELDQQVEVFKEAVHQGNRLELETIKNKNAFDMEVMKNKNISEIEAIKNQNAFMLQEYGAIVKSLSERRIKVIEEVSWKLSELSKAFQKLIAPFRPVGSAPITDDIKSAIEAFNGFLDEFRKCEIYLDEGLCKKIQECIQEYRVIHYSMEPILTQSSNAVYDSTTWSKSWKKLTNEMEEVHSEIKNRFRTIIGVIPPTSRV